MNRNLFALLLAHSAFACDGAGNQSPNSELLWAQLRPEATTSYEAYYGQFTYFAVIDDLAYMVFDGNQLSWPAVNTQYDYRPDCTLDVELFEGETVDGLFVGNMESFP
jgi:hypothetical protein